MFDFDFKGYFIYPNNLNYEFAIISNSKRIKETKRLKYYIFSTNC